jgi:hypothetical protein
MIYLAKQLHVQVSKGIRIVSRNYQGKKFFLAALLRNTHFR